MELGKFGLELIKRLLAMVDTFEGQFFVFGNTGYLHPLVFLPEPIHENFDGHQLGIGFLTGGFPSDPVIGAIVENLKLASLQQVTNCLIDLLG